MIAEALKHMLAAGMDHSAIIAAVADMEASLTKADPVAERRRAYDRERKRTARMSGGSPVESEELHGPPSLDKESSPQTPFKEIKPNPVCVTGARKGTRIPDSWIPTKPLPTNVKALANQWPPGRYDRELDGFRDYWSSRQRNATMLDWDKGWWNRIRDQHDRIVRENRNGQSRLAEQPDLRGSRPDPSLDLLRLARAAEEEERASGGGQDYRGAWPSLPSIHPG